MNVLSFRRSPWYLSGVFILVVVVLTLVCVTLGSVFFFITILSSSFIRLLVGYGGYRGGGGRDGLVFGVILGFGVAKVGILPTVGPNAYSLSG